MVNKISALITTYNESQFLKECLNRLTFCDEIIVVDLGSSDNCVEIAESFGAKILHHELVPFAEHVRNFAIENARNEWVLFSDPDMYFAVGIGEKIENFLSNCPENIGVIHLPAVKYFNNQPIRYGTKSAIESRAALINTRKVDFLPLVHYSGIQPKEGILHVGMIVDKKDYIAHYWVKSMKEAVEKAKRYIPSEPERRHHLYKKFTIRRMLYEFYKTLQKEFKLGALKSCVSFRILLFNLWYLIKAYSAWISYERGLKRGHLD